jgi:hypothetical protein
MVVICKGKTIQGSWQTFPNRLEKLLSRFQFPASFIKSELSRADGYTVSKTNSKSMLSFMNQIVFELEYYCHRFPSFDTIELNFLEDRMMDRLHQTGKKHMDYLTPLKYWQREIDMAR